MVSNLVVPISICLFTIQAVAGLFWDFTRPTNNAGQAAAGGAFLGAAGLLTLCWVKDNCRGKREINHSKNVSWIKYMHFDMIYIYLICFTLTCSLLFDFGVKLFCRRFGVWTNTH